MARPRKPDDEVTPGALRQREYRKSQDKERARQIGKNSQVAIRLECLRHYSQKNIPECNCCGETIFEFLHLDHGFGDGAEHRRQLKALGITGGFYYWLKKNNWPDDLGLQVLCSNCDFGKKDKTYCPHELKRGVDMNSKPIPPEYYPKRIEDLSPRKTTRPYRLSTGESRSEYQKRWKVENYDRFKTVQKHVYVALRLECLQRYGGLEIPECCCCKEKIVEFLTLDHVEGGGSTHQREIFNDKSIGGNSFYYKLKKLDFPNEPRLQVLCVNCNFGKRTNKYCPHELLNGKDMDGNAIPSEYYPPKLNFRPTTKGPEHDVWLESPEGLQYREKQAAGKRGKPSPKDARIEVPCAECRAILKRKQCEMMKRGKPQTRFFCNMKCSGKWKSKNLVKEAVYNYKSELHIAGEA